LGSKLNCILPKASRGPTFLSAATVELEEFDAAAGDLPATAPTTDSRFKSDLVVPRFIEGAIRLAPALTGRLKELINIANGRHRLTRVLTRVLFIVVFLLCESVRDRTAIKHSHRQARRITDQGLCFGKYL
jgi:hypothetical protein